MFRNGLFPSAAVLAVLLVSSCASGNHTPGELTPVALVISTADGTPPTPQQLRAITESLQRDVQRQGMRIASALHPARYELLVRFIPDPTSADKGQIIVLGAREKPRPYLEPNPVTDADAEIRRSATTVGW